MQLKRIGPLSLARLAAGLYGAIGLFVGAIFAVAAMVGASVGGAAGESNPLLGLLLGAGAIVFLPLIYGVLGALGGAAHRRALQPPRRLARRCRAHPRVTRPAAEPRSALAPPPRATRWIFLVCGVATATWAPDGAVREGHASASSEARLALSC